MLHFLGHRDRRQRRLMMQWYADYLYALADGTAAEKQDDFSARILR